MKWFRFYHDAIDDPKVQRLSGDLFKFWINMLCLASRSTERGVVKLDVAEIAFATRLDDDQAEAMLTELCRRDLLDESNDGYAIHNWDSRQFKSDDVAARVAKHRSNAETGPPQRSTSADETLHETLPATPGETLKPSVNTDSDTETDTEETHTNGADAPGARASRHDYSQAFERFWAAYPSGHGVKKTAYDQWKRLKPDDLTQRKIMAGLDRWKACDRWQRGFVKSAHIWLRERWWENDPPPAQEPDKPAHLKTPDHDEPFDFWANN